MAGKERRLVEEEGQGLRLLSSPVQWEVINGSEVGLIWQT